MNQLFGICNLSIIPQRAEASDKSELVSQLLFGDVFEIIQLEEKWALIKTQYDGYEGWIDRKQFSIIESDSQPRHIQVLGLGIYHPVKKRSSGEILYLLAGSAIPVPEQNIFTSAAEVYELLDDVTGSSKSFASEIEHYAKFYLGSPYLWGGKSLFGIDCSGFTQIVFKQFGIPLLRDAKQQAEQGKVVDFLQQAKAGDLAFFDNEEGRITHVGIMINNEEIIHASGKVRIDRIDNQGIYNHDLGAYTHKLRIVKRLVD